MRVLRELLFWSVAAGAILGRYILAAGVALCISWSLHPLRLKQEDRYLNVRHTIVT
jgi:hypothetical protein